MRIAAVVLVATGGAVGSLGRLAVHELVGSTGQLPASTLLVNVVGSLLLGLLVGHGVTGRARLLWGTGVLGGFTTYSTFAVQTEQLVRDGEALWAVAYPVVSVIAGLVAAVAGLLIGRRLAGGAA